MPTELYLDYASRWPLRPEARQAWNDAQALVLGDPARAHGPGRRAEQLLHSATETTAAALGADARDVVWTSGGTESVHSAVLGTARAAVRAGSPRRHLVVSAVEHSSVLRAAQRLRDEHGFRLDIVDVDGAGQVDPERVAALVDGETLAVHLQHANHEIGTLQPTHEVSSIARRHGALLHVDACQSVGQLGVTLEQLGADLLSASSAKFGGPAGVGLLALGPAARLDPLFEGDEQQRRRRAGQLDVAAVAAAAVALEIARSEMQQVHARREVTRRRLREALADVEDVQVHGPLADAHPGIVAVSALYVDGAGLLSELARAGYAAHSGSSCASESGAPSHVLVATGGLTHGHVRFSFGGDLSSEDVDDLVAAYREIVSGLRRS